ncbi:MAG TPA: EndoU domain-containing protein [Candidatus Nanopelagicales bacterium]|nr:EndoU domain-containing protein [Candidatus Nanopelagicales bacterium]
MHELEWNGRGQLVRRSRGDRAVTWSYDTAGRRTAMTTPDGHTTRYGWDAADRLTWVEHPLLGRAVFDRDATGRLVSAVSGGLIQSWEHRDGFVVGHTLTDDQGASRTAIERDSDGRIRQVRRDDHGESVDTDYGYDGACQLIEARTRRAGSESLSRWRYDPAGRLVTESTLDESADEATIRHVYDLAGQLLTTIGADGHRLSYGYDGNGRRTSVSDDRGPVREYSWNPTGYLAGITEHDQDRVRRTRVHADALGELAAIDGTPIFWDTAGYAGAPVLVGDTPVLAAGPVTGIDTDWTAPGWRTSRATAADPWNTVTADCQPLADGLLGIGAAGELSVGGLEWLGARVYDPASRGFLTTDPHEPTTGAGWSANPYSYAGNDPLHALDPTGLRPVTDNELQAYRDSNGIGGTLNNAWNATTDWLSHNWEYVAGGAAIIAGGVLIATGVGGPVGLMLISAGADTIIQKATTGSVNWGQVGVSFVAGGIGGGFAAAKLGVTGLKGAMIAGAASGGIGGAGMGAYQYGTGPGPHTVGGYLGATASGGATGAIFGSLGGAASHGIGTYTDRILADAHPSPEYVNLASPARTSHILDGEVRPNGTYGGGHRAGTGFPSKSEFPASWSDGKTMHNISDVATDPASATRPGRGGDVFATGTREDVDIEVLIRHDEIWTGYPTNVPRNP